MKAPLAAAALAAVLLAVALAPPASSAGLFVTNTNDSGAGSLRQAIIDANNTTDPDTITITATGTVTLQTLLPEISQRLSIVGPGSGSFTVARDPSVAAFRIFTIDPGVTASISGVTISGGDATPGQSYGGGIQNQGDLTLDHVVITGNKAAIGGGGIANLAGSLNLTDSTVSANTLANPSANDFFGGGIYAEASTSTNVLRSTIAGNTANGAQSGGGGGIGVHGSANVSVVDSTISGNFSKDRGGGIGEFFGGAQITLTSVTLASNSPVSGGTLNGSNVYVEGNAASVAIQNTLVAFSSSGTTNCVLVSGASILSLGHNLDSGSSCNFSKDTDLGNVSDPKLGGLADNGGPTQTRALDATSPAVDRGTAAGLTTDQRGVARSLGAAPDIGAYEYQPPAPTTTPTPTPSATPAPTATPTPTPVAVQTVQSPISNFWTLIGKFTRVRTLYVSEVPTGGAVTVACSGKGCPFKSKKATLKKGRADLKPFFKNRKLPGGIVIEVRITAPGMNGKVVRYTLGTRKFPTTQKFCLPKGTTKPKKHC